MTGFEVGGIVLAAASISFQLFAGCVQGFQFLTSIREASSDSNVLQHVLQLERHRLHAWSERSGLSADKLDPRLDEDCVKSSLAKLQTLLTDANALKSKYGISRYEGHHHAAQGSAGANALVSHTSVPPSSKDLPMSQRFRWVVRDRSRFEDFLLQIRRHNDALHEILSDAQQDSLSFYMKSLNLHVVTLTNKIDSLAELKSVVARLEGPESETCSCAAVKAFRLELEARTASILASSPENVSMESTVQFIPPLRHRLLEVTYKGATHCLGVYNGKPVFIEWKAISPEDTGMRALEIDTRVAALATLLSMPKSDSFRSLTCRGYLEDTQNLRYCFIFDLPPSSMPNESPRSLLELFYNRQYRPSLSWRLKIAYALASSLRYLHATGWLHKGIRSDNVVFFQNSAAEMVELDSPYLVGYEFARFDSAADTTQKPPANPENDIYRHPSALAEANTAYNRSFDIYSFGLVLLELIKWKPLKHIAKPFTNIRRVSMEDLELLREALLDNKNVELMPDINFRAGDIVHDIIWNCLAGLPEHTGQDSISNPGMEPSDAFTETVVKELARCVI